jgi:hypothetical protein
MAGVRTTSSAAFSANHSYYDSSNVSEYWGNRSSYRTYPFFRDFKNIVRMYPIMSPSKLMLSIQFINARGVVCKTQTNSLDSPSGEYVEIDVNAILGEDNSQLVTAYTLVADSDERGAPTRITHQMVVSDIASRSPLQASIAVGLKNDQAFAPAAKRRYTWGQVLIDKQYRSKLGLVWDSPTGDGGEIEIDFYSESGKVLSITKMLLPGTAILLDKDDILGTAAQGPTNFLWFVAKSARPDLTAYSVHQHLSTHHCSGEHGF